MITLCFRSVLYHLDPAVSTEVMFFKPEFLTWLDDQGYDFDMTNVCEDHNPGYQVRLTHDFEIHGLTDEQERLWVAKWGESPRQYPDVLPDDGLIDREPLIRPYDIYSFTVEVCM